MYNIPTFIYNLELLIIFYQVETVKFIYKHFLNYFIDTLPIIKLNKNIKLQFSTYEK